MSGNYLHDIAVENRTIVRQGHYPDPRVAGRRVSLRAEIDRARNDTKTYLPADTERLVWEEAWAPKLPTYDTIIEVTDEKSLTAAWRLYGEPDTTRPRTVACVLNFANAQHPGGGYIGGARAQEEDLCRCSALYPCLASQNAYPYYLSHNEHRDNHYYTHAAIYSPNVPVFRSDEGYGLFPNSPYPVDFLTCAAPYATGLRHTQTDVPESRLALLIQERVLRILAIAAHYGKRNLVLGAWGCGAFGNNPRHVAAAFANYLRPGGPFYGRFERVVFAVFDPSQGRPNYNAFRHQFAAMMRSN